MGITINTLPKHHAVLITSSSREILNTLLTEELKARSPAHRFFNQTVIDIETARSIITWALTPYHEEKIALISFHTIGLEAQNALLKVLEEPRAGVRFILITSALSSLIETVLSRVCIIEDTEIANDSQNEAKIFLQTKPGVRMKLPYIVSILSATDEERRKDRELIRQFILSLSKELSSAPKASLYVEEVLEIASYAADPSASSKAILEYLGLLLPKLDV